MENKFIVGSVQTIKVDKDYPENTLSGAVFEIYVDVDNDKEFNPRIDLLVGEMTEGENGLHTMENLRHNGYFLYEKTAPEGFLKDDGYYYFEIRVDGEVVTVENEAGVGFVNKAIKGSVITTKIDQEYPENKLSGAVFEVYVDADKNGEFDAKIDTLLGELSETEKGIYSMAEIRYGGYFLYEKTAPEGFVKDNGYYYFEIRNNGEIVTVENQAGVGFNNRQMGDKMILDFANILRETLPADCMIFRWGGDEFTVLVSDADCDKMGKLISQISAATEAHNLSGEKPEIYFAAGYALSVDYPTFSREELLKKADEKMYHNKSEWYHKNVPDYHLI